jgi:hypothetical protein
MQMLRARLSKLKLWNTTLNVPAPEVRAAMNAHALLIAGGSDGKQVAGNTAFSPALARWVKEGRLRCIRLSDRSIRNTTSKSGGSKLHNKRHAHPSDFTRHRSA